MSKRDKAFRAMKDALDDAARVIADNFPELTDEDEPCELGADLCSASPCQRSGCIFWHWKRARAALRLASEE